LKTILSKDMKFDQVRLSSTQSNMWTTQVSFYGFIWPIYVYVRVFTLIRLNYLY